MTEQARKLLYSERKALAETGTLGALTDKPAPALVRALRHLVSEGIQKRPVGKEFMAAVEKVGKQYLDWSPSDLVSDALLKSKGDRFLDLVEVIVEEGARMRPTPGQPMAAIPNASKQVNDLFDRYRFGYRIEEGEIGSPTLDETIVGPALLAI